MKENFKKTWLVNGINTLLLVAILIAAFVFINLGVKKWDPTPIDVTKSQDFTLTEESKNRVKNIDKDINIYFVGFDENDKDYKLAKQYNKANSKINVELIDVAKNQEIAKKYSISSGEEVIVIECGKNSRTLTQSDIYAFDSTTFSSVDVAEQKITSAILNVTIDKTPKAYFLAGYTEYNLNTNLTTFAQYLENEVLTYESLNILNKQKVPDDCDTLIIMTPSKDFDDLTRDAIINYIKKGGNILWFNGIYEEEKDFKNVNKVLEQFGVNKFEKGIIYETDADKMFGTPVYFAPEIVDNSILKDVKQNAGAIFFGATKININTDSLEKLNVEEMDLMLASEKSYFTKDLTGNTDAKNDERGSFVVGAQFVKTISEQKEAESEEASQEAVKSTLIIYGNDEFITDEQIQIVQGYPQTLFSLLNNKDVALNSLAYLTNNDQDITIRKSYSDSQTTFTPTDKEKTIITDIIFIVPVAIIVAGIIVWIVRKNRN